MPDVVECRGQLHQLLPGEYWHLTHPNGILLSNVRLAEGIGTSISAINRIPGLELAVSRYAMRVMGDAKEQTWEAARLAIAPNLPSRKGAVFLFEGKDQAETAMQTWFPTETRTLIKARIVEGATIHVADARLLDGGEEDWHARARDYWQATMTATPFREVLVDGFVYFPGWRAEPFGSALPTI